MNEEDQLKKSKPSDLKIYLRLLSYVIPYLPHFLVSIIGFGIFAGSQVAFAEWLKRVIDYVGEYPNVDDSRLIWPILLVLIALIRGISFFIGNYLLASISNRLVHELRTDLFNKIPILPSSFFDSRSSGHLISRITFNVMQVTGAATNALKILIREGLLVIGLVTYLMVLNPKLASIFFIAAPFIAVVVSFAGRRLRKISNRIQTAMGDVTHVASETINAYREVKAFGGETYEIDRFSQASDNNRKQNLKLEATNAIASPLVQFLVSASLALITWLALDASVLELMTPGGFVAFFGAAGMLAKPVRQLSEINSQIQKGLAAASDIFEQLDEEPETNDGTYKKKRVHGSIEFKDLSFSYDEGQVVLEKINLQINSGETVAFVGRSGAGKTTLVSLIPRFYGNYQGEINLDGISLKDYEIKNLRSHISLVGQNSTLFNDTVYKNISYGLIDEDLENIQLASSKAHADEFIRSMPDGYETKVGEDGVLLSGGQKQRIAIARAILKDSPILILDEATSALDSESEEYIQQAMSELTKGRTTLVIAHRLSTIESADKIVVLDEGKIVEQGTHKQLLSIGNHYAKLHAKQFKDDNLAELSEEITREYENIDLIDLPLSQDHTGYLERAWYNKSPWLWLLWPLSLITKRISLRRLKRFQEGKLKSWKPKVPVIIVGNIVAGGTGKTPFVIWLANSLTNLGYKPGIVSRGYGGRSKKYPLIMDQNIPVQMSGDEPKMIFRNTNSPVYVSPNRVQASKKLVKDTDCDLLISDDGLQHYPLGRDIEIVVFDGSRGSGNGLCLPAGPLREPLTRIELVDFVVSSGSSLREKGLKEDIVMNYKPKEWVRLSDRKSFSVGAWPLGRIVHAFAGIGNPAKFFLSLKELGFTLIEHSFPDHYQFQLEDFLFSDKLPIIMSEKDAERCSNIDNKNIWYLKVEADLSKDFIHKIVNKMKEKSGE
tara:strand:- start:2981 stop:5821 length:2841 start_codon:yes stop_codon:yes gene_type:complete